jgi:hypothetical protein
VTSTSLGTKRFTTHFSTLNRFNCFIPSETRGIQPWCSAVRHERRNPHSNGHQSGPGYYNQTAKYVVNSSVSKLDILMSRFTDLATFDGAESRVSTLVMAANSHDNLCRMDPAWHPWL